MWKVKPEDWMKKVSIFEVEGKWLWGWPKKMCESIKMWLKKFECNRGDAQNRTLFRKSIHGQEQVKPGHLDGHISKMCYESLCLKTLMKTRWFFGIFPTKHKNSTVHRWLAKSYCGYYNILYYCMNGVCSKLRPVNISNK